MSTPGHFFVGRGESAEWLGTVWHDGYPEPPCWPAGLRHVYSEAAYRQYVDELLRDGVCSYARPTTPGVEPPKATVTHTHPGFTFAFDEGRVWVRLHDDWVPFDAPDALERLL